MAGFAVRVIVIEVSADSPAMFVFPGTVSLFTLIILIKQVALEILHSISSVFQIKTTGKLVAFVIKLMVEAQASLEIGFVQVIVVAAVIIAVGKRLIFNHTHLGIIQIPFPGTTSVPPFQIRIEGCAGQCVHPTRFQRIVEVITFAWAIGM